MSDNLIIRKATVSDAVIVALLARITFDETFGHHFSDRNDLLHYFETTFSVAKMNSSIAKENNVFWLAFLNDLPVGYAKLKKFSPLDSIQNEQSAQLQKIYVLKDCIGKQVGPNLQEALFTEVQQLGIKNLWLSVLKTNYRAIRFYEKNDFKPVGEHLFSVGKETFDFYILLKKIN